MRRVLITGTNRGLGLALTSVCLARGDQVFATTRRLPGDQSGLASLSASFGERLHIVKMEVGDPTSVDRAWQAIGARVGAIDWLINNAGVNPSPPGTGQPAGRAALPELDPEIVSATVRTNALGPLLVIQRGLDLLRNGSSPRVVNISSQRGSLTLAARLRGGADYAYTISKAALNMFTCLAAAELQADGISVVAVHPGWVRTDMGGPRARLTPDEAAQALITLIDGLTLQDTGKFFNWDGTPHPW